MEKKKLVIIDDDVDILKSLEVILEDQGFEVHTAPGKEEGVELCSEVDPDLIILDIMMESDLEGFSMLNDFRKPGEATLTPIIMYSGMAQELGVNFRSAVEDEHQYPRVSFVDKREEVQELIAKINEMLC
jgi:DNA-binding NtrC family response regulator